MLAVWLENRKIITRKDLAIPEPGPGEALVKVLLAGICATDLELISGYYPFTGILGHEFVGVVEETTRTQASVGNRVVGEINITCGECSNCRAGRTSHCEHRSVLGIMNWDGVFAEYLVLPVQNLHIVPDSVSNEAAVFTEPLAAALEIQEQIHIHPEDRVLVVGAGRLGQLIAQTLSLTGCNLAVVARYPRQQELLDQHHIHFVDEHDVKPGSWDIVVESTGSPAGFELARSSVRPRGTIVLKSTYKGGMTANFSSLVVDEIILVGSRCGPFSPALRLIEKGMIDPTSLIDDRYPLNRANAAIQHASQPGVLKILLDPSLPF